MFRPKFAQLHSQDSELTVHYRESGSGSPLVLLHGLGAFAGVWSLQQSALAESFRVYSLDLPGCGQTPAQDPWHDGESAANWVAAFVNQVVGEPVGLVGHSMGGAVALMTALRDPGAVSALVLVAPAGLGTELNLGLRLMSLPGMDQVLVRLVPRLARSGNRIARSALDRCVLGRLAISADCGVIEEGLRYLQQPQIVEAALKALREGATLLGQRPKYRLASRLNEVVQPTLLVWGSEDSVLPIQQGFRATATSSVTMAVMAGCGHVPFLDQPELFTAIARDFLVEQLCLALDTELSA